MSKREETTETKGRHRSIKYHRRENKRSNKRINLFCQTGTCFIPVACEAKKQKQMIIKYNRELFLSYNI